MPTIGKPSSFLDPSETLEQLLHAARYEIPGYQRDYSWGTDQVDELWSDLKAALENAWLAGGMPNPDPKHHFFGPIVLQPSDDDSPPAIMDGQQRMVTFSLLLATLRSRTFWIDPQERDGWDGTIEELLFKHGGGQKQPRISIGRGNHVLKELTCKALDRAQRDSAIARFWDTYREKKRSPEHRIAKVARHLVELIDAFLEEIEPHERGAALIRLIQTTTDLCLFLKLVVKDESVAYEVFEGLNARGLDLSQADLIKNKLFESASVEQTEEEVEQKWDEAMSWFYDTTWMTVPDFLHFHFQAKFGEVKATELYGAFSGLLAAGMTAQEYISSVLEASLVLRSLLDKSWGQDETSKQNRDDLELLKVKYSYVLPIGAVCAGFGPHTSEFAEIVAAAKSFTVRRFLVGSATQAAFAADMVRFANGLTNGRTVDQILGDMRNLADDRTFRLNLRSLEPRTMKIAAYLLRTLERNLAAGAFDPAAHGPMNQIEHILPQKPEPDEWPMLKDPAHEDIDQESYTARLGNLLVLERRINASIKNHGWLRKLNGHGDTGEKVFGYVDSSLKLPHTVAEFAVNDEWTYQSIERRQAVLADLLVPLWPLGNEQVFRD